MSFWPNVSNLRPQSLYQLSERIDHSPHTMIELKGHRRLLMLSPLEMLLLPMILLVMARCRRTEQVPIGGTYEGKN